MGNPGEIIPSDIQAQNEPTLYQLARAIVPGPFIEKYAHATVVDDENTLIQGQIEAFDDVAYIKYVHDRGGSQTGLRGTSVGITAFAGGISLVNIEQYTTIKNDDGETVTSIRPTKTLSGPRAERFGKVVLRRLEKIRSERGR